jgi:predicted phosphodiesterase
MRIAVISDVHGNVKALEAVLDDLAHHAPDAIVNLGDCVSGPLWPEETAVLLRGLGWPTVRGNHDRVVAAGNVHPDNRTDIFTEAALSAESLDWLRSLKPAIRFSDEIFLCHGTPRNDDAYLTEAVDNGSARTADEADILHRLDGETSGLICCGHSHLPRVTRLHATGQTVLNPGSVGLQAYSDATPVPHVMANHSPHARYALIEEINGTWTFILRAIDYDWQSAAQTAAANGRPDWAHALATGRMQDDS